MVIGAPPKSYKSFIALNIAYDLAEGRDLFGLWKVPEPLSVLLIEQEIGKHRLKERLAAIHSYRLGQVAPFNLYLASKDLLVNLHTAAGIAKIKAHLTDSKAQVLIIDPLRKFHRKAEDDSTQMVEIFGALDGLQEEFDLSTIIVHHTAKRSEFRRAHEPEALRGSGEIFADVDTVVMIEQPVAADKTILRLHFTLRSAQEPPPLMVKFNKDTMVFNQMESGK